MATSRGGLADDCDQQIQINKQIQTLRPIKPPATLLVTLSVESLELLYKNKDSKLLRSPMPVMRLTNVNGKWSPYHKGWHSRTFQWRRRRRINPTVHPPRDWRGEASPVVRARQNFHIVTTTLNTLLKVSEMIFGLSITRQNRKHVQRLDEILARLRKVSNWSTGLLRNQERIYL